MIARFRAELGDADAVVLPCFSGTGANMLAAGLSGARRLLVAEQSHIALDEEGGPLQLTGATQTTLPAPEGRLAAQNVRAALADGTGPGLPDGGNRGCYDVRAGPAAGTLRGRRRGRFTRARGRCPAAARTGRQRIQPGRIVGYRGRPCRRGWHQTGLLAAEVVLSRQGDPAWWRRSGQLPAKTRYVAAQWAAIFPDRWLSAAATANLRARELADALMAQDMPPCCRSR